MAIGKNLAKNAKAALIQNPVTALSTAVLGTWVDMANYEGCLFVTTLGAGTTAGTFKIQSGASTTATGTDLSGASQAIVGANDNKAICIDVYSPHNTAGRYLRSHMSTTGGAGTWDHGGVVAIQYNARKGPTSSTGLLGGGITLKVVQTT